MLPVKARRFCRASAKPRFPPRASLSGIRSGAAGRPGARILWGGASNQRREGRRRRQTPQASRGSQTLKRMPPPVRDSTVSRPPWARAICRAM